MHSKNLKLVFGFTLIEILVIVGIAGMLISAVVIAINPASQLKRTRDVQRASDLKAVQVALEAYRVSNNIYPASSENFEIASTPWGSQWDTYLRLPTDPLPQQSYAYVSESGSDYQLYAKFESSIPSQFACNGNCGPQGAYNAGIASSNSSLTVVMYAPTPTPIPAQPPAPLIQGKVSYFGSSATYPKIIQVDFDPLDVATNQTQLITAKVWSENPIIGVTVYVELDNSITETYQLAQTSATISNGVYKDTWAVSIPYTDTHNNIYTAHLTATDSLGKSISPEIIIR